MINPKKFTLTIIAFLLMLSVAGQSVIVKKESERINGMEAEGYATELDGIPADVNSALTKYLKTFGKVKHAGDYSIVTETNLSGKPSPLPIFATTKDKGKSTHIWIGIKSSEWATADAESINKQLEKLLYDFGVKFYRDKIQLQIDESTQALYAVEKQQQRFVNQNADLNTKLENNKREKIKLEQALAQNKIDYETLLKKIEINKHHQDSLVVVNEQVKKVVEMQKEKQRKVN